MLLSQYASYCDSISFHFSLTSYPAVFRGDGAFGALVFFFDTTASADFLTRAHCDVGSSTRLSRSKKGGKNGLLAVSSFHLHAAILWGISSADRRRCWDTQTKHIKQTWGSGRSTVWQATDSQEREPADV